ncbi:MAG: MFS transporter [Candidatus Bathyarchaeia archaeon]
MWRLGFFFHEIAFGLLSVFLPLYIVYLSGSLLWVGVMSATAILLSIPASFFWGYMCDRTRHYKIYILMSFSVLATLLYLFSIVNNATTLVILYSVMALFHVAHEPPKNVLVAELYSHEEWKKVFASYECFTEIGWLIGLVLGVLTSSLGFNVRSTLLLCSGLNIAAFFAAFFFVEDPIIIFERSLVSIEKAVSFAYKGVSIFSRVIDGVSPNERLRGENLGIFCLGLAFFSFATSLLFTPMPIFISNLAAAATLPSSIVFAIFVINSSGGVIGYFFAGKSFESKTENVNIGRIVLFRGILTFLLILTTQPPFYNVTIAIIAIILFMLGFAYAIYLINALYLSMELIPKGKAGLFDVLVGIGSASGAFIGPFIAQTFGFVYVFLTAGLLFLFAYLAFKLFI